MASNGAEAVDRVKERMGKDKDQFGLILLDVNMPVLNGIDAAKEIRSLGFNGKLVGMTAGDSEALRDQCYRAGMSECLLKPIDLPSIVRIMQNSR